MSVVGEVHRFVPGAAGAAPTLLVLHGTGGDENDLLPLAREVSPSASLLAPRGPVLENGMARFFRRFGDGGFDLRDLATRTAELSEFVRASAGRYGFDPARVYALGYSNGANIAASLLLSDGTALAGAVLLRAMRPFEPETRSDLKDKPVLIASGESDPYVSVAQAEGLAKALRQAGARVEHAWSRTGHGLLPDEVSSAKAWFTRASGAASARP